MPVPTPHEGEEQNAFVSRCISTLSKEDPGRERSQVIAICFGQWRNKEGVTMHPQFERVLRLFMSRYGTAIGLEKFSKFVGALHLDTAKPYHPRFQFSEAFEWAKPYIEFLRRDKGAKYYAIRALHAIVSMNDKDYTDYNEMQHAAKSMNYRPVNINHNHSKWLPYPRTRLDYSKAEDFTVEGILRVDNADKRLQMQLDHAPSIPEKEWISHPSIEGRPDLGGMHNGYHFTALALLEQGHQLPGDPLSEIIPLFVEAVNPSAEVCLFIDGEKICLPCVEDEDNSFKEYVKMETELNEDTGTINPEGALCPQCGHKITPDPTIEAQAINCPRCDTVMVRLPEKVVEALKAVADEDILEYLYDNQETLAELFRPPFPFTPNRQFTKTDGATLAGNNQVDGVGNVDGVTIGLVECQQARAQLSEDNLALTKTLELSENTVKVKSEAIADLEDKIAEKDRLIASTDETKAQLSETMDTLATERADHKSTTGKLKALKEAMDRETARVKTKDDEIGKLSEDLGNRDQNIDTLRNQLSSALESKASSNQTAINETRERSRIQNENADLRENVAKLTREISKLTESRAGDAKRLMIQEQEIATLKEQATNTQNDHTVKIGELVTTLSEARKFHKWAWDKLKEAGYMIVDESKQGE